MIVCQECGNSAPSVDGFCSSCGGLLEWSGEQVATPPPPPPYAPPLLAAGGPGWSLPTLSAPPHAYQPSQAHQPAAVRPDAEAVRPAPQQLVNGPQYDGLFCSACGTRNLDGRTFCRYCGHELDLTVATGPARLRWWQRLFRRTPKAAPRAGERPGNFGKRSAPPPAPPAAAAASGGTAGPPGDRRCRRSRRSCSCSA